MEPDNDKAGKQVNPTGTAVPTTDNLLHSVVSWVPQPLNRRRLGKARPGMTASSVGAKADRVTLKAQPEKDGPEKDGGYWQS